MLNHTETEMALSCVFKNCFQTAGVSRNFLNNLKRLVWVSHWLTDGTVLKLLLPDGCLSCPILGKPRAVVEVQSLKLVSPNERLCGAVAQIPKLIPFSFFFPGCGKERTALKQLKVADLPPVKWEWSPLPTRNCCCHFGHGWVPGLCLTAFAHPCTSTVWSGAFHCRFLCPVHAPGS